MNRGFEPGADDPAGWLARRPDPWQDDRVLARPTPRALCALSPWLIALVIDPTGAAALRAEERPRAVAHAAAGASAAAAANLPGRFVVRGAPLARRGKAVAGRSISVYARPPAVVVEGCRSRSQRVRRRSRGASVSVVARCPRIRGPLRVRATISGATMRGTAGARSFTARLKPPRGKLLKGRRSARALRAVRNSDALERHGETDVSRTGNGARVARTAIVLRLARRATVGQVNAALKAAGGRIASALSGSPQLVVAIPDPGTLDALDRVLATLGRMPGVDSAGRALMAETQELPPGFSAPLAPSRAAELSHLLALRMPAAWNARRAVQLANRPTLIVADVFGNGPLSNQVDATYDQSAPLSGILPLIPPASRGHGYHVVGIAAANFASNGSAAGRVTGVFPARTKLTLLDVFGLDVVGSGQRVLRAVREQSGHVVVNTSIGYTPSTTDAAARKEGSDWAEEVRSAGYANRLVHAGSAGNSAILADRNSPWVAAALRTDLTEIGGSSASPLPNTLAVENLTDTGTPAFEPGCLSTTSNRRGNIAAVGAHVFSNLLGAVAGNMSGTSQASPQAAALAEYLWSIAPDLTAPQVVTAMIATARPPLSIEEGGPCDSDIPSSPRLDAYTAVLSLDQPTPVTPSSAPVRFAIMDRNGDGAVTETDLQALVGALPSATPSARDWSRADLNGDGFTGGPGAIAFDLDPSGSTRAGAPLFNTVAQTIEGVSVPFDERNVSDVQALCFYAYSGLYTGSPDQRKALLNPEQRCGAAPLEAGGNCSATTAFGLAPTITGTSGDDNIHGTSGDDVIIGGDGDDRIEGLEGNDRICGGAGDDTIAGGSGNADSDDPDGGGPLPRINSGDDLADGGPGTDRVHGTGGNDRVFGGEGDGDSVLGGSPGSDFMAGGPGINDVCTRAEIPIDGGAGGADSFGEGCEFINNF
jgi:Subtilase family/RTX calcium-binding nonapeptide repeat (4 copies)